MSLEKSTNIYPYYTISSQSTTGSIQERKLPVLIALKACWDPKITFFVFFMKHKTLPLHFLKRSTSSHQFIPGHVTLSIFIYCAITVDFPNDTQRWAAINPQIIEHANIGNPP